MSSVKPKAEADNNRALDYCGYHKTESNIVLLYVVLK